MDVAKIDEYSIFAMTVQKWNADTLYFIAQVIVIKNKTGNCEPHPFCPNFYNNCAFFTAHSRKLKMSQVSNVILVNCGAYGIGQIKIFLPRSSFQSTNTFSILVDGEPISAEIKVSFEIWKFGFRWSFGAVNWKSGETFELAVVSGPQKVPRKVPIWNTLNSYQR